MTSRAEQGFRPAWWLPEGHTQTLWPKFFRPRSAPPLRAERIMTPDGDFLDLHHLEVDPVRPNVERPHLFMLHGLEGTVGSHYVGGLFTEVSRRGWGATLLVFRGCGTEPNLQPRFYHSGETADLAFALNHVLASTGRSPIVLAGVSLGGNVLLKWLGERGADLPEQLRGAAAISVPFDLERGARHLQHGFARVYDQHFLKTLRQKARNKLARYPGLFDDAALHRARTIYDFDDVVTAPVHGFASAHDYYHKSSSIRWLERIRLPTFLLNAIDDPFLPADVLDQVRAIATENPSLTVEFPDHGGHVGFVGGWPWRPGYYAEWRACQFLASVTLAPSATSAHVDNRTPLRSIPE